MAKKKEVEKTKTQKTMSIKDVNYEVSITQLQVRIHGLEKLIAVKSKENDNLTNIIMELISTHKPSYIICR